MRQCNASARRAAEWQPGRVISSVALLAGLVLVWAALVALTLDAIVLSVMLLISAGLLLRWSLPHLDRVVYGHSDDDEAGAVRADGSHHDQGGGSPRHDVEVELGEGDGDDGVALGE